MKHLFPLALALALLTGCGAEQAAAPQTADPGAPVPVEQLTIAFSPYADSDTILTATEPLEQLLGTSSWKRGMTYPTWR